MPGNRFISNTAATLCLILLLALLEACQSSPLDDAAYPGSPHAAVLRDRMMPTTQQTTDTETVAAPPGNKLDNYIRLALERNPALRAARQRVAMLSQRVPQVTSLDDPMLQVAPVGEMAQTASGQVGLMSGLSQKLPFPGKLSTRGRIAEQDVAVASAQLEKTRLQVIADVRRAYWSDYFACRAIEVTREGRDLLSQLERIARSEYEAGTRSQQDVLRASVELSSLDNELTMLAQRQATAKGMLNQLMDRPVTADLPDPPQAEYEKADAKLDELLAQAAEANPSIRMIQQRIEQDRQKRKLARLNRWPDLTVGVVYNEVKDSGLSMAANGRDQWWMTFGVNLPIWTRKYDAAEREALHATFADAADLSAAQNQVAFRVQDAYLRVDAQQRLFETFRDSIVPQARQTLAVSQSGYQAGALDFLTLVDNWRKLLNFQLMQHRAMTDLQQALADLDDAVGRTQPQETTP